MALKLYFMKCSERKISKCILSLSKRNFKIDHSHCSKLCLLKCIILLEKQHFRIFQYSNIRNESRWVNKSHFLFDTTLTSVTLSKVLRVTTPAFQNCVSSNASFCLKNKNIPSPEENCPRPLLLTVTLNQTLNLTGGQFLLGAIVRTRFSYFWVLKYPQWKQTSW